MSNIITPKPGRIVWFHPTEHDGLARLNGNPLAAIVAGVHNDRLVNLAVFDAYGNTQQRSSVHLVQPGDEAVPDFAHATWMPYQVGQAAKAEKLEEQNAGAEEAEVQTGNSTSTPSAYAPGETDGNAPASNVTTESQL